jgi:hypothetical protein
MKKLIQILLLGVLAGCSGLSSINLPPFGATATPPPPVDSPSPSPSETPVPTQNLFATSTSTPLTFTPTVTLMGAELFTPTASPTATVPPTQVVPTPALPTPGLPPLPSSDSFFTPESIGFQSILLSSNIIYWNEGPCSPRNIQFSAFVVDVVNTQRVYLFTRLREKKNTLNFTRWNAGAVMIKDENGSFNYNLRTINLRRYYYFVEAWLEYQLVALNENQEEIGRTPIYDREVTLVRCRPVQ